MLLSAQRPAREPCPETAMSVSGSGAAKGSHPEEGSLRSGLAAIFSGELIYGGEVGLFEVGMLIENVFLCHASAQPT